MNLGALKAKKVIDELGISEPTDLQYLKEICMYRKVFVREENLEGAEARLTVTENTSEVEAIISVKPNMSYETRTRFSIAHELGHFEMHKDIKSAISCNEASLNEWFGKQEYQQRETQANEFASELLMPEKFIKKELNIDRPSLNLVEELAEKYDCSYIAVARRLIDLTDEGCAIVFFRKNRILYHISSKCFKDQRYWIAPGPLDSQTFAHDVANGKEGGSRMSMVDASGWIDTSNMKSWQCEKIADATVLEQSRYFSKLDLGISLIQLPANLIWN